MNNLDRFFSEATSVSAYAESYMSYLAQLMGKMDFKAIENFALKLIELRDHGKRVFFIGNGGSAATASHFANDLQIGPTPFSKKSFKAIALTDSAPIMTCIGNDFGYEEIFTRQLEVLMEPGDCLVALSASGNSPNILSAVNFAKKHGHYVISLTGFDGGKLRQLSDLNINVETPAGEYGPVEDGHMILDHLVSTYLIRYIRKSL